MSQKPRVSIIIPCFNAARWLPATLESALGQTWANKEVIVVDDGSTDDSLAVAGTFAARGVRIERQSNQGASAARNRGLDLAQGEYIQFLDADDLLAADKIARQLELARRREGARLLSGEWGRFTGDPATTTFSPMPTWRDLPGLECQQIFRETHGMMHPAAWLSARSLLDRAGPWDVRLTVDDDGEYFQRVMLEAGTIHFCPGARSFYRSNLPTTSLSQRRDPASLGNLYFSCEVRSRHLLGVDESPRTRRAVAQAWKQVAYDVYPERPELSAEAERIARNLGGGTGPVQASGRVLLPARLIGWRMAKRLFGRGGVFGS